MASPDDCTCENHCPGFTDCMCVYTYDDGICECECTGPIVITASRRRLSLYTRVAVDTGEVSLARLGEVLAKLCGAELFIPAAAASEKVALTVKDTTLGDVVKRAGLVVGNAGQADTSAGS
jgi:hypothetical protein